MIGKVEKRDIYIDIEELAQQLSIKKRTLYHLVQTMEIPHYRIGKLIRFKQSEIDEWMETKKCEEVEIPLERVGGI
jgi:excisionase family DNA binding protein